jgi:hypothetical protein
MAKLKSLYITETPNNSGVDNPPSFFFDALISFSPTYNKTLSKYSISDKSVITNHSVKSNPTISLSGLISRMPLDRDSNNLVGYTNLEGRPSAALEVLKNWYNKDTELYLADQFDIYNRYVITNMTYSVNGSYDSLRFDLTLEHVRRVGYQKGTLIQYMNNEKSKDAQGKDSKGSTTKKQIGTTVFTDIKNALAGVEQ